MLYILATPIGNLADLSDRAKEILRSVPLVIAENPSYSQRLFEHIGAKHKPRFIQFAEHNEGKMLSAVMEELQKSDAVLMSDAGTPGISDPGFRIVREAVAKNIPMTPIPGPNAAITALSASGLPTDKFVFLGFVPKTELKLISELRMVEVIKATVIFYESPHRIAKTIHYIANAWPGAHVAIARELTKLHEEFMRGTAVEVLSQLQAKPSMKGEFVVMVNFK